MSAAAAADEDYALSFDNINGTAVPNATWPGRPVIGKTGTLGNGNSASEAWFVGAIPQYAMAIGLWTNTQAQNLDNLPGLGGIGGSFGGDMAGRDLEGVHGDPVRETAGRGPAHTQLRELLQVDHGGAAEAEEAGLLARASSRTAPANMARTARTPIETRRRVKGMAKGAAAAVVVVAAVAGAAARQRQL